MTQSEAKTSAVKLTKDTENASKTSRNTSFTTTSDLSLQNTHALNSSLVTVTLDAIHSTFG